MAAFKSFRDLLAWQAGMDMAVGVYQWTRKFPADQRYSLVSQMQRSGSSVPYNIAEGWGLGTARLFVKHLRIARGSMCELETQMELAARVLGVVAPDELSKNREKAGRLLQGLIDSMEEKVRREEGRGAHDAS